jgi:hypothetical protein
MSTPLHFGRVNFNRGGEHLLQRAIGNRIGEATLERIARLGAELRRRAGARWRAVGLLRAPGGRLSCFALGLRNHRDLHSDRHANRRRVLRLGVRAELVFGNVELEQPCRIETEYIVLGLLA